MHPANLHFWISTSHQKVVLEIDFTGGLWGYTEITIVPTTNELRTIHLHSRQCTIHSVTVGSYDAEFVHHDPIANISFANAAEAKDCHRHPELKRKLYSALADSDEGELSIALPHEVLLPLLSHESRHPSATPEPQVSGSSAINGAQELSPIVVKIGYSLRNPVDGFEFILPNDAHPNRVPHAYTTPSSSDSARCWVPCVDNIWERCTWEFEFVVPRYLEEPVSPHDEDSVDLSPTMVVCSGDLVEQVAHPYNSNKTIFLFNQAVLTSVQHIAVAAGPFHLHNIPPDNVADDPSQQPLMHAFCLPGHELNLATTTSTLRSAMSFYSADFGSYPFGSYKVVFVDELPTQRFDSASLSLLTVDFLHGEDVIEQAIESRHALSHALACQWVGINILPKTWSDLWLTEGLGLYITGLFLRKLLGNNEYRFRLKKDMRRVLDWDNGSMPPLCQPTISEPPDSSVVPFLRLKAPLILHILDRRLGKSGTSLGLSRVLPKIFLSAISGEMQNNALATHAFIRTCRRVSGVDLRFFAEQWIYGSGCPAFGVSASFNRKKMAVEITMRQECPAWKAHEGNAISMALLKPVQFFEGQMTIRIHEADGTPYEHVLDIRTPFKRFEVPFNTKYKRVRRNTKRYLARQAAAQAAAEGDADAAEAIGMIDMGFGLEIWEKEQERENWKVADWTEEDEGVMSGATYEWIRMDADFEWIANLEFGQPDFMWVSQLQRDRDVVAQLEAIHALARQPTAIVSSTLTRTVLVTNYHYRIRCEAATALVHCAIRKLDFLGLFHLFKLFLKYCYDPEDPNQDLFNHTYVPKPNDFADLSEYFVRKSIVAAISHIRFENGKSPAVVKRFLVDQLRYNDNTSNPYSDGFYICTIISAAACAAVSTAAPERGEILPTEVRTEHSAEDQELLKQALAEVDRYRSMDRLIPSPHNIVTIAALEFYLMLSVANLIPNHSRVFFPLTRYGNYTPVRLAAFDGLFLTKWYTPQIMGYILAVVANDPSRTVRRAVARNICHSLALLVQMGEMKAYSKDQESLLIEEDGSHPEKTREARDEMEAMIKVLRKDREVGKNEVLRNVLMPIALAPDVDHEVRWCMIKVADLLMRPVKETAPSVVITIPVTPVAESPSMPTHKALRLSKPSGVTKSPLVPINIPPKLKIPGNRSETPVRTMAPKATVPTGVAQPKTKGRPPKHGQPRTLPKAQSAGMSLNDLRACRSALKKLRANKYSRFFLQPVDPVRDGAPKYFEIIKEPMDLSTMSVKLEAGQYSNRSQFENDFRLIISNAKQYNLPDSHVHKETVAFDAYFNKQWSIIHKTLEQADRQSNQTAPRRILPPVPPATFSPPPSTGKAPIKLRVNPTTKPEAQTAAATKSRNRKSKTGAISTEPDAPPPPYVDDGSHDLLQEVLAIEREKDEERNRHRSDKLVSNVSSHKRKKPNALSDDDDILALATPSKKEKPTPPESLATEPKILIPIPMAKVKNVAAEPKSISPSSSSSLKGKEKEQSSARHNSSPGTPINDKKCKELLKALQKLPEAGIFLRPVDPILDGCPTYLEEIAEPMDFGTISMKLNRGDYPTMEQFAEDIRLVFSNCRQFNPPATFPVQSAEAVEKVFNKEWIKATQKKLSFQEKRGLQGVMTALVKDPLSWIFRAPVDPVALQIPHYFDIIPRKDARDLRTIREKLDGDRYDSTEAFEADLELMIYNAFKFNGAESEIGAVTKSFQTRTEELLSGWKASATKKRKDGDKMTPQPTKKVKLG